MKKLEIAFCLLILLGICTGCKKNIDYDDKLPPSLEPESNQIVQNSNDVNENILETESTDNQDNVRYQITKVGNSEFDLDGNIFYAISYTSSVASDDIYSGYMNEKGIVFSSIPKLSDIKIKGICCGYKDCFLFRENLGGLDEVKINIGVTDSSGNWLYEPVSILEISDCEYGRYTDYQYLGDGMFSAHDKSALYGNELLILNSQDGSYILLEDVSPRFLSFYDGIMIYQHWDGGQAGGHRGDICSVNCNGISQKLDTKGDLIATNSCGFLTDGQGLSFYNTKGELIWTFDQYDLDKDYPPIMYNEYTFVCITGADGNAYFGCLNEAGDLMYTPFRCYKTFFTKQYIKGKYLIADLSAGKMGITDLVSGETLELNVEGNLAYNYQPSEGPLFIMHVDNNYIFFTTDGQQIVPNFGQ